MKHNFKEKIFSKNITKLEYFNKVAIDIFNFQYNNNLVYKKYVDLLKISVKSIVDCSQIPFLPVDLFRNHKIIIEGYKEDIVFSSSGTVSDNRGKHFIADLSVYENSIIRNFEFSYGCVEDYCLIGLLPTYLERNDASLTYMVKYLYEKSGNPGGLFASVNAEMHNVIDEAKKTKKKIIIIGVSFALLEFCENYKIDIPNLIIMETGGMKGKRKEMIREQLHKILCKGFGVHRIHSEYGMTELLSQAYSNGDGVYQTSPSMKIIIRELNDPFSICGNNIRGGLNIIDLANYNSCSFIATQDIGFKYNEDRFAVLGRIQNADIRGCNTLLE